MSKTPSTEDWIALADGDTTPEVFEATYTIGCGSHAMLSASILTLAKSRRDLQRRVEQLEAVATAATPARSSVDRVVEGALAYMIGYLTPEADQHPEALRVLQDAVARLRKDPPPSEPRIKQHKGLSSATAILADEAP